MGQTRRNLNRPFQLVTKKPTLSLPIHQVEAHLPDRIRELQRLPSQKGTEKEGGFEALKGWVRNDKGRWGWGRGRGRVKRNEGAAHPPSVPSTLPTHIQPHPPSSHTSPPTLPHIHTHAFPLFPTFESALPPSRAFFRLKAYQTVLSKNYPMVQTNTRGCSGCGQSFG